MQQPEEGGREPGGSGEEAACAVCALGLSLHVDTDISLWGFLPLGTL